MNKFIKSPFMYIDKPKFKFLNKKDQTSISYKQFDKLISEGVLKEQHYDILRLLFDYRYLTTSTIDTLLKHGKGPFWRDLEHEDVNKTINSYIGLLRDHGIVSHSMINWEVGEDNNRKRTPGYYKLTRGGVACLKKIWNLQIDTEEYCKELPVEVILKELAINQMIANYKLKVKCLEDVMINRQIRNEKIKSWYNLYAVFTMKKDSNTVQFIVEPVRRNNNWKKDILIKMSILHNLLKVNNIEKVDDALVDNPAIILLCEDVPHAKECFKVLHDRVPLGENLFFTTDSSQLSSELINSLMKIKATQGSINLMEYEISFLG